MPVLQERLVAVGVICLCCLGEGGWVAGYSLVVCGVVCEKRKKKKKKKKEGKKEWRVRFSTKMCSNDTRFGGGMI